MAPNNTNDGSLSEVNHDPPDEVPITTAMAYSLLASVLVAGMMIYVILKDWYESAASFVR
jgi:hypothetical protein